MSKTFGTTRAVRDLDLDVPRGSICGFLGPNGAGKSTTIRMIMSIIYPDAGRIEVLGGNALSNKDRIGYLPEERGLYRKMRVGDFLDYMARLKGAGGPGLAKRVRDWLDRVELPQVLRKRCQELSKGMQQKIQVLAAIIHEPELIILDEPFSGLDPVNAELLNHLIKQQNEQGRTIIFSTHVLHQAEQICDRFFLINRGVKVLDATLEEIGVRFDPRTVLVETLNGAVDFSSIRGVRSSRPMGSSRSVEIEIDERSEPQQVIKQIVATCDIRSIELRRLSMEEVFVRVVRSDLGERAAQVAKEELSHGTPVKAV
ncbi:MAG: ATP-binding cassette domain-containing protein [Phycisphaerales bacterium]|nr:ATP-binding cassette domain-containing protein [Phycisphaerales bacterium]MCI0629337.1 ATP-binding cassette domain-containing protein [Phycisphaerales bacterium]MCI0674610.1 ATP-binding cassette domain-containing protein [Phycisphaerales bacterium]